MNKTAAKEWLTIAYHDLTSAKILYEAGHFTDSIGCDLQQALEKTVKSILAGKNVRIPKSDDLLELYGYVDTVIQLDDRELVLIAKATEFYKEDRYPNPQYELPTRDEVFEVLVFSEIFFSQVCNILNISEESIINE